MITVRRAIALAALFAVPATLPAGDFWETKPVGEWTLKETWRFLHDSPWVQPVTISRPLESGDVAQRAVNDNEARRQPCDREGVPIEPQARLTPSPRLIVYWVEWASAGIVREAKVRLRALRGACIESANITSSKGYIIRVRSDDLKAFDGLTDTELRDRASLRPHLSQTRFPSVDAQIERDADGRITALQFAFPRQQDGQPVISEVEKSVKFVCHGRDLKLKARFDLEKMAAPQRAVSSAL